VLILKVLLVHQNCAGIAGGGPQQKAKKRPARVTRGRSNDSPRQPFEAQDKQDAGATRRWTGHKEKRKEDQGKNQLKLKKRQDGLALFYPETAYQGNQSGSRKKQWIIVNLSYSG
jgi:hypothetical protein